ncbi:MAG TPA: hypothetical protein VJR29_14020 [bacterium]|nr:hypothetical protein [bacterium]
MSVKKNEERLYDIRTLDNYLSRGLIKPTEYDKYLKSLPDEADNYELVQIDDEAEDQDQE